MSTPDPELPSPKDIVLGVSRRTPKRWALIGGVLAGIVHVGMGAAAYALGAPTPVHKKMKPMVVVNHVVDLAPKIEEPPPPPPPVEEPPPPPPPKVKPPKAKPIPQPPQAKAPPPDVPESEPPPAAQAAQVVAADKAAESQAAFNIATGSGDKYAGGTTSASGTGKEANHTGQVGTGTGTGVNHARAAMPRLRGNWPCGWPDEAEDLDVDEAFAIIKVSVGADGSVSDVQAVQDPGFGFGRRAMQCARSKVKFDPALDAAGQPIAGTTPPLRVRFLREE